MDPGALLPDVGHGDPTAWDAGLCADLFEQGQVSALAAGSDDESIQSVVRGGGAYLLLTFRQAGQIDRGSVGDLGDGAGERADVNGIQLAVQRAAACADEHANTRRAFRRCNVDAVWGRHRGRRACGSQKLDDFVGSGRRFGKGLRHFARLDD